MRTYTVALGYSSEGMIVVVCVAAGSFFVACAGMQLLSVCRAALDLVNKWCTLARAALQAQLHRRTCAGTGRQAAQVCEL